LLTEIFIILITHREEWIFRSGMTICNGRVAIIGESDNLWNWDRHWTGLGGGREWMAKGRKVK
jgi:hypothetical protein